MADSGLKMRKVKFEIEGISPILFDQMHGENGCKTEDDYRRQAEKKVYLNEAGELCIPSVNIKACMREASSELGKRTDAKKNRQSIKSGVFFEKSLLSLGIKEHHGIREDWGCRGQGAKVTRVKIFRPKVNEGWKASGTMLLFAVEPSFVEQALALAGVRFGLCGYRPEFGRFVVNSFTEENGNG